MKRLVKGCNHTSKAVGMADGGPARPMTPADKKKAKASMADMASWAKSQPKSKIPTASQMTKPRPTTIKAGKSRPGTRTTGQAAAEKARSKRGLDPSVNPGAPGY